MRRQNPTTITRNQYVALKVAKAAQTAVRYISLGRYKPFWVLHLAGHYTQKNKNRKDCLSETSSDSDPYNLCYI